MNPLCFDILEQFRKFEIEFITNTFQCKNFVNMDQIKLFYYDSNFQDLVKITKLISDHKYKEILNMDIEYLQPFQLFLKTDSPLFYIQNGETQSNYQNLFPAPKEECIYVKQLMLLLIAVSALQEFVRVNMCGPNEPDETEYFLCNNLLPVSHFSDETVLDALIKNTERTLTKISHPKLLYLSLLLLFCDTYDRCLTQKWWLFRCLMTQQRILHERVPEIHKSVSLIMKSHEEFDFFNGTNKLAEVMFYVECAHSHLYYHEIKFAEEYITKAKNILGLSFELSGAVGKRTKFQSKAVAQLLVKTTRDASQYNSSFVSNVSSFTPDLCLQDDTLLNSVKFTDQTLSEVQSMLPEEQLVILAHCSLIQRKMDATELKQEEVMAFVNFLLSQPKIWSLHVKCLTVRCQVEKTVTRKFERSLTQLEELINSFKREEPPFSMRQAALYSVAFPLKNYLEKILADLLMKIGSLKSALEIYERLHLWEDVVICYKELGMTSKAVELLERLIAEKPSPILYCYYGDVTDDPEKYKIAWEFSNKKSSHAQRCLGYYYFKRKDYKSSIDHLKLSVELNHLQPTLWFSLGFAATEIKDYKLAIQSYRQVVSQDDDNFEAWNNLANAYIKENDKFLAWRSLQQALKCNYEEWRVWENFLLVSTDVGSFEDVIRSFHRLLDIKGKHVDIEVLRILVDAIHKDLKDINSLNASRLRDKALQLFGRITSMVTNNPTIWELYSILVCSAVDYTENVDLLKKAVTFQHKALKFSIHDSAWVQKGDIFTSVLRISLRYAYLCLSFLLLLSDPVQKQQQKSLAKISLQNVVARADKAQDNFTKEEYPTDAIFEIKNIFEKICNL